MNKVVDVRPLHDYRIWLRFSDGTQGDVDLSDLAGRGVFAAWADPNVFTAVRVEQGGGIEWPGEIDMCPRRAVLAADGQSGRRHLPQSQADSGRCLSSVDSTES